MQLRYHGVAESTRRTYQSGLVAYTSFNPLPATSLTEKSQSISYQTLKVYLVAICLMHIEHGLPDPTVDQTFLVCRGMRNHHKSLKGKDYLSLLIF